MSGVVLCGWRGRGWWLENCLVGGGVKCVGECRRERNFENELDSGDRGRWLDVVIGFFFWSAWCRIL